MSTDEQLDYLFKNPGTYKVRLYATNGSCEDTTNPVNIVVDDPTADGVIHIESVTCYNQDKVQVKTLVREQRLCDHSQKHARIFFMMMTRVRVKKSQPAGLLAAAHWPVWQMCFLWVYSDYREVGRAFLESRWYQCWMQ